MAYATGTASNYRDLVGKLRDFLVANTDLVTAGQNWTLLSGPASGTPAASDELVFSGPGLAGDDDVRFGVKFHTDAGLGYYNVGFVGLTSSGVNDIENQPGASYPHWMLLLNTSMTYRFVANGRRVIVVARTGASYQQAYAGFILPEHLPDDWPYPLFVGACAWDRYASNSRGDDGNRAFWNGSGESNLPAYRACGALCDAGRVWRPVSNIWYASPGSDVDQVHTGDWYRPYFDQEVRQSLTNQPIISAGLLFSRSDIIGRATYGRFDGLFYLPAFGVTPDQVITISGINYLAVPNVFRTSDGNFCAIALD